MNIIDFILILSNLTIFIVVQILFFNFIMSKLTLKIIKRNFKKIKHLIPDYTELKVDTSKTKKIKTQQNKDNIKLIINNIVYPSWHSYINFNIIISVIIFNLFQLLFLIYDLFHLVIDKFEYMNIYKSVKIF